MGRFKGIICLYLTVAVLMTVALMPFSENSLALITNTDEAVAVTDITDKVENIYDIATNPQMNESTSAETVFEKESATDFANTEEVFSAEKTETDTEKEENIPSEISVIETVENTSHVVITTEKEDINEDVSEKKETVYINSVFNASYAPGNIKENIYDLYFLSPNVGSLSAADAVNVYTFTLLNRGVFRYSIRHKEMYNLSGWTVSLYGEYYVNGVSGEKAYRLLNTLNSSVGETIDRSVEIGLPAGEYRLVVTKGKAYTSETYEIDAVLKDSTKYEVECNDNIYRYTEIFSGIPLKGSASNLPDRQDEDYYMFRMYEDGYTELKFEHPSVKDKTSVCWQVILYSEDGKVLYSTNSLFSDTANKSGIIGLTAGNYYVLVKNRVYTDMNYTLSLTRTDDMGYENEKNDTTSTANIIALNSTVIGSVASQINSLDRDYFKFTVEKTGYVVLEFSHEPISDAKDKNGWNYVLTNSKGELIYAGVSAWSDDVAASPFIGLGGGTYYIRVDSENLYHNSEKYYLSVNYTESDEWESERNNSFGTADALIVGTPILGLLADCGTDYDFDYYTFTLTEKTDITVIFSHEVLQYSKDIFTFTLYDKNEKAVSEVNGSALIKVMSDSEEVAVQYKSLAAGKYYIKVATGLYFDHINYSLCVEKGE